MAATTHHKTQPVLAREVDRRRDVGRALGRHRPDARLRCPGIDPAAGLCQGNVVTDVMGVLQALENGIAGRAAGRGGTGLEWRLYANELVAQLRFEALPL